MPEYRGGYDSYIAGSQEWHVAMGLQIPPDIERNPFIPSSWLTSDVRVQTIPTGVVKFESSDISGWNWTATALRDGECDAVFRMYDRVYICHIVATYIDPIRLNLQFNSLTPHENNADGSITYRAPAGSQISVDVSWDYNGQQNVPDVDPVLDYSSGLSATWTESNSLILVPGKGELVCDFNVAGKVQLFRVVGT
jgi:hypothetical protein